MIVASRSLSDKEGERLWGFKGVTLVSIIVGSSWASVRSHADDRVGQRGALKSLGSRAGRGLSQSRV